MAIGAVKPQEIIALANRDEGLFACPMRLAVVMMILEYSRILEALEKTTCFRIQAIGAHALAKLRSWLNVARIALLCRSLKHVLCLKLLLDLQTTNHILTPKLKGPSANATKTLLVHGSKSRGTNKFK